MTTKKRIYCKYGHAHRTEHDNTECERVTEAAGLDRTYYARQPKP